jgi:ribonucleoside-diphosphate reductase alpha chain
MKIEENLIDLKENIKQSLKVTQSLKVVKRDGKVIDFDHNKITLAITKAFLDEEGNERVNSARMHDLTEKLTSEVCESLTRYLNISGSVHIENIQDQVELVLMRNGFHKVARSYVLYREAHRKLRANKAEEDPTKSKFSTKISVTIEDGSKKSLDLKKIEQIVNEACHKLENADPNLIIQDTLKNLFDGVHIKDVYKTLIMSARTLIETEPSYSFVAARLLLHNVQQEVSKVLKIPYTETKQKFNKYYGLTFVSSIQYGIKLGRLNKQLNNLNLEYLSRALKPERDFQFNYLGLQTLYDRYLLHENEIRYELPQIFFMRVAMGLALNESEPEKRAIEFYDLLSSLDFMSSTPTLFNSGTCRSQLSSCYLSTIPDDLAEIYNGIRDNALLQKFAGGIGNDWTPVRAMNSWIKSTNGKSQGVIPFLKVANDTAVAVNQGGKRKGAVCAYLETWHLDIEEFLELRKNTGDERRRTHDMNTANWIPDLFMKRVMEDQEWTLFSPEEVPDLHDLYGSAFEHAYVEYEKQIELGTIKNFKKIPAVSLWRKMLSMLFETGHPWITFKDAANLRSPQQHAGVVHSSNLCTEITLNTSIDEIAVCNLGSVNLAQHITNKKLDIKKLEKTIKTAIRMLDNVIDSNYYSVPQARNSNLQHRPIGLGLMGFQDALYQMDICYQSEQAVEFADLSMEYISYFAISASSELAKERGAYKTFEGSLWSKGILPIDSIEFLNKYRGIYLNQDTSQRLDWDNLREKVRNQGMRNSNVMAIAPTATISNICGVSQSIEPTYQNLYVKSNLSGEFTVVNHHLVNDLKQANLWDIVMVNDLKYFNGSLQEIDRIPQHIKDKYATAFEIDPKWLIDSASRRQKWIDQGQSLNLYIANPSGKKLDQIYKTSWLSGLKTTYYLRSLAATDTEKSTINRGKLNAVKVANTCSIDDPSCESCQ